MARKPYVSGPPYVFRNKRFDGPPLPDPIYGSLWWETVLDEIGNPQPYRAWPAMGLPADHPPIIAPPEWGRVPVPGAIYGVGNGWFPDSVPGNPGGVSYELFTRPNEHHMEWDIFYYRPPFLNPEQLPTTILLYLVAIGAPPGSPAISYANSEVYRYTGNNQDPPLDAVFTATSRGRYYDGALHDVAPIASIDVQKCIYSDPTFLTLLP